jgi:outer membrane protein OmpA-like peptidoglycan-associated protein
MQSLPVPASRDRAARAALAWLLATVLVGGCNTLSAPHSDAPSASRDTLETLGFAASGDAWVLALEDPLSFDVDSDRLGSSASADVGKVAKGLLALGVTEVRIEGHTDNTGGKAHNTDLSRRRAARVAEQMVKAGFPASGIEQRGLADAFPIASNRTPEGRARNRRVTITVVPPRGS